MTGRLLKTFQGKRLESTRRSEVSVVWTMALIGNFCRNKCPNNLFLRYDRQEPNGGLMEC